MKKTVAGTIIALLAYILSYGYLQQKDTPLHTAETKSPEEITLFLYENDCCVYMLPSSQIGAELSEKNDQNYVVLLNSDGTLEMVKGGYEALFDCDKDGLGDISIFYSAKDDVLVTIESLQVYNRKAIPSNLADIIGDGSI